MKLDIPKFIEIVNSEGFETASVFIFITKLDSFARDLPELRILGDQTGHTEAPGWASTAQMYAQGLRSLDRRDGGRLRIHIADQINDDAFNATLRDLQSYCSLDDNGGVFPVGLGEFKGNWKIMESSIGYINS